VFVDEVLLTMVKKTLDSHVFPNLASITIISIFFDFWMSSPCGHFCPHDKEIK
jgi:hypothetical protein